MENLDTHTANNMLGCSSQPSQLQKPTPTTRSSPSDAQAIEMEGLKGVVYNLPTYALGVLVGYYVLRH